MKIMALRCCLDANTESPRSDRQEDCPEAFKGDIWMDALRYAADNGADVVNASLGSPQQFFPVRKSLYAIDTLELHAAGACFGSFSGQ